jgi:hypothetical protein
MSVEIQRRRGSTAEHNTFTGVAGELTVDTTKWTVVVHDGSTAGGFPLALEDHVHSASDIIGSGVVAITNGGTGASTAASALASLGGASLLHVHDSSDIVGVGSDLRFVVNQSAFASAYAGSAKTIVLGANSYTLPGTLLPGVNLVSFLNPTDVVLTGGTMGVSASSGGAGETTLRNITIDGQLFFASAFDSVVNLENVRMTGAITLDAASALVELHGGQFDTYAVSAGTLRTYGARFDNATNIQSGGTVYHKDIEVEASSSNALMTIGAGLAETTRVTFVGASQFVSASAAASYWRLDAPAGEFYVWYSVGSAIDPVASGTGIQVSASTVDNAATVASNTASALDANANFNVSNSVATITIVNASVGSVVDAADVSASILSVSVTQQGEDSSAAYATIEGIRFSNPGGPGIQIKSSSIATIDGALSGSVLTNGVEVFANAILHLGTHNLSSSNALVVTEQGQVIALEHPIPLGQTVRASNVQIKLRQRQETVFIPTIGNVITDAIGIPNGLFDASTAPREIVIHPEFILSGFFTGLRIQPLASAGAASSMNIAIKYYAKRAVGTTFADGVSTSVLASQLVDSNGLWIGASEFAAGASAAGLGFASGFGLRASAAADPFASVGGGISIEVTSLAGGSTMEDLMVTYFYQIDRSIDL